MKNKILCLLSLMLAMPLLSFADEEKRKGSQLGFVDLFNGKDLENWVDVNTSPKTWRVENGILICSGNRLVLCGPKNSTKILSLL